MKKDNGSAMRRAHEVRVSHVPQRIELRKNNDGSTTAQGYFATWNTKSKDLGFREVLKPGCFSRSLRSPDSDVQALFNHNDDLLLGRESSGTLKVQEDATGLRFEVRIPATSYGNDLVVLMERGDVFECSFAFAVPNGGDTWSELPNGELLRTINEAFLYEGSLLASPAAYPNTSANLRSLPAALRSKLKRNGDDDIDCDDPDNEDDEQCEDEDNARVDQCELDSELETLRLRLRLHQHRAKTNTR